MGFIGVYGGLFFGLLGWFIGRHIAKKKRGLDELYQYIWQKARATSWMITAVAIYVFFTLELSGITINTIPLLSMLLFVHLVGWAISGVVYSIYVTDSARFLNNKIMLTVIICITILILFLVISIVTHNWRFFLFSLPPVFLNIMLSFRQSNKHVI